MHGDGNVVLYKKTPAGPSPVWRSNTSGNPGARITMQTDGNLVIRRSDSTVVWSNAKNGKDGSYLVLHGDGNLVQYQPVPGGRSVVWQTHTGTPVHTDHNGSGCPAGVNYGLCERSASQARTNTAARAIKFAFHQVGKPYSQAHRFGPNSYDCSGLLWKAYANSGVDIGANLSSTIITSGGPRREIPLSSVRPGDMVWTPGHIVMELADGRILEAAKPGTNVRVAGSSGRGFTRAVTIDAN